jgi:hypothetical protein
VIPKRVFWFTAGVTTGFVGAVYSYARIREVRGRLAADRLADTVADTVVGTARTVTRRVGDALDEGRQAAREAERRIDADIAVRSSAQRPERSRRTS